MFCMRLFGSCWGVGAQQRALLEAHYGPASAEADAEAPADDFGDWHDDDDDADADRHAHRNAAPAPAPAPTLPTLPPRSAPSPPAAAASAAVAPPVLELSGGGRPVAAPRPVRPVAVAAAAAAEALAEKEEDFFADMAPTVKQAPVVPLARAAAGPSRLALSVRSRRAACAALMARLRNPRRRRGAGLVAGTTCDSRQPALFNCCMCTLYSRKPGYRMSKQGRALARVSAKRHAHPHSQSRLLPFRVLAAAS